MIEHETLKLVLSWVIWGSFILGGLVLAYWACFVARRARRFCPGVARGRWAWLLWPPAWVTYPRCGYDLTSLPEAEGLTLCPECGRKSRARQRRRSTGVVAHVRLGAVLTIGAAMVSGGLYVRSGAWAAHLPDTVTLATRQVLGGWTPRCVRAQYMRCAQLIHYDSNYNRVPNEKVLWSWQRRWALGLLIGDLRDDSVVGNAEEAVGLLDEYPHEETTPLLAAALASGDYQQRQIAAAFLRRRIDYASGEDLVRVTVEGFRRGCEPVYGYASYWGRSVDDSWEFLRGHEDVAEPFVARGLESHNELERFLCAAWAASARRTALLDVACPILVQALGDDRVGENAKYAVVSLLRLGRAALPYLERGAHDADAQRRQVSLLLIRRLNTPDAAPMQILESDAAHITDIVAEPSLLGSERGYLRAPEYPSQGGGP